LFLAIVIGLFGRRVIGWSMHEQMTRRLVINALRTARFRRRPARESGMIFHSDRGSQYASEALRNLLGAYGITASMSRRGNCWGNACRENTVRLAEGETATHPTLHHPASRQGRNLGMAAVVQPVAAALDLEPRQPNAVRAMLADRSGQTSQHMTSAMGYVIRGQDQWMRWKQPGHNGLTRFFGITRHEFLLSPRV
jgi:hypothetical protein